MKNRNKDRELKQKRARNDDSPRQPQQQNDSSRQPSADYGDSGNRQQGGSSDY
ncbi:MAG: hypothetical protein ACREBO_14005 [Novosphingobium sp.]